MQTPLEIQAGKEKVLEVMIAGAITSLKIDIQATHTNKFRPDIFKDYCQESTLRTLAWQIKMFFNVIEIKEPDAEILCLLAKIAGWTKHNMYYSTKDFTVFDSKKAAELLVDAANISRFVEDTEQKKEPFFS